MLTCKEAIRLVSEGLDRRLSLRQRLGLWMHVAACKGCTAARAQLTSIDRLVRARLDAEASSDPDAGPPLTPEVKERIRHAVHEREA